MSSSYQSMIKQICSFLESKGFELNYDREVCLDQQKTPKGTFIIPGRISFGYSGKDLDSALKDVPIKNYLTISLNSCDDKLPQSATLRIGLEDKLYFFDAGKEFKHFKELKNEIEKVLTEITTKSDYESAALICDN